MDVALYVCYFPFSLGNIMFSAYFHIQFRYCCTDTRTQKTDAWLQGDETKRDFCGLMFVVSRGAFSLSQGTVSHIQFTKNEPNFTTACLISFLFFFLILSKVQNEMLYQFFFQTAHQIHQISLIRHTKSFCCE